MKSGLKYSQYEINEEFGLRVTLIICILYVFSSTLAIFMIKEFGRRHIMLVLSPFVAAYLAAVALSFNLSFYSLNPETQSFGGFQFFLAINAFVLFYGIGYF